MCGRFTLVKAPPTYSGRSSGSTNCPACTRATQHRADAAGGDGRSLAVEGVGRELVFFVGLVPSWAEDLAIGNRLLNRGPRLWPTSPPFVRRCEDRQYLVLADGFFEWQASKGKKQPFYFRLKTHEPFAIAGLWESWSRGAETVQSCVLLPRPPTPWSGPRTTACPCCWPATITNSG